EIESPTIMIRGRVTPLGKGDAPAAGASGASALVASCPASLGGASSLSAPSRSSAPSSGAPASPAPVASPLPGSPALAPLSISAEGSGAAGGAESLPAGAGALAP